ncbi:hypothetical protein BBF96_15160 [Anoxybacter fermentans]|uniref:GGDEF domain-containing protein n=1 Tax=Anoxybacter fermentans TaxID=1323375 RepID=A0A3S9T242_9FIRM|nr:GGDEF domain-containing protein [Anoxybacter fermentans]AZR74595.1 hypothetical protein BBF96_15160 [Anoxybacter fermentans]
MDDYKLLWEKIKIKLICVGIPVIGLTILFYNLPKVNPFSGLEIIFFMIVNIFAELLIVELPIGIQISLSYPIMICVLLLFGPIITMWVYIPALVISQVMNKREPFKIIYNVSQISISIYIVSLFLPDSFSTIVLSRDILWIFLVIVFLNLLNITQVVLFISVKGSCNFFRIFKDIWFKEMLSVLPIYYATGLIMAVCYQAQGVLGSLIVIAPLLGIFSQLNIQNKLKIESHRANTDALTGLFNRRALTSWWQRVFPQILNTNKTLSVLMIDIDDFKKINDAYGHDVGDKVLKSVAGTIKKCIRRSDFVYRFGGEEFIVLLPESDINNAKKIAERVRLAINKIKISQIKDISVSIGVSGLNSCVLERSDDIPGELIRQADIAMYVAKREGKNRIWIYS